MSMKSAALALAIGLVLIACKQPADAAANTAETAPEAAATATVQSVSEQSVADEDSADEEMDDAPQAMTEQDGIKIALSMMAAVEQCGLSTPAESAASLAKIKQEAAKSGVSTAGIDAQYTLIAAQVKAGALQDPTRMKESCAQLRAMRPDPEELKKMQEAVKELEKTVTKMEAEQAG